MWDKENPQRRYCLTKVATCAVTAVSAAGKEIPVVKIIAGIADCLNDLFTPCEEKNKIIKGIGTEHAPKRVYPDYINAFLQDITIAKEALDAVINVLTEYYGDDCWLNADPDQVNQFFSLLVDAYGPCRGRVPEGICGHQAVAVRPEACAVGAALHSYLVPKETVGEDVACHQQAAVELSSHVGDVVRL